MRVVLVAGATVLILGVSVMTALAGATAAGDEPTYNRPSAVYPVGDIGRGSRIAASCSACHGGASPSVGDPAFHAPKLRYQRPSSIFYALQDYRSGQRKSDLMQPIAQGMSDQDMRDVAIFLSARTLRARIPPLVEHADTPAHQKNSQVCGMCHGETGLGEVDGYPVLGGQHQDYLEHALLAYRSGERANPIMRHFARSLKPGEVQMMAGYFAGQSALEPVQ